MTSTLNIRRHRASFACACLRCQSVTETRNTRKPWLTDWLTDWMSLLWHLTNTHPFNSPFPGLPRWAGTRKVEPIWILLKQETVSGSGISWAICQSAPRSRQITTPAPHRSVFYRPDALPVAQPTASKQFQICGCDGVRCRPNARPLHDAGRNARRWWLFPVEHTCSVVSMFTEKVN